ncbi:MAG: hypothetical protein LBI92_07940 [Azoarcus sp.]|jgi:hypothetical protein|nr:hypothetical protein [Azoarcus sp.]
MQSLIKFLFLPSLKPEIATARKPASHTADAGSGPLSFLALETIGAALALNYGLANTLWAILFVGTVIFLLGFSIARYIARYRFDMYPLAIGTGPDQHITIITAIIYMACMFAFLAIEAAIIAIALRIIVDWPLPLCYALAALIILPITIRAISCLARLPHWTHPLWLFLIVLPFVGIALHEPAIRNAFTALAQPDAHNDDFRMLLFAAASTSIFPLLAQIIRQVSCLRLLPPPWAGKQRVWWTAVIVIGPSWIVFAMLKMAGGALLVRVALALATPEPMALTAPYVYFAMYCDVLGPPGLTAALTALLVAFSYIRIDTNSMHHDAPARPGFFNRAAYSRPIGLTWLIFTVFIAALSMTLGFFAAFGQVLGILGIATAAWIGALTSSLAVDKVRAMSTWGLGGLEQNPSRGFNATLAAMWLSLVSGLLAWTGLFGETAHVFAPCVALVLSLLLMPLLTGICRYRCLLPQQ